MRRTARQPPGETSIRARPVVAIIVAAIIVAGWVGATALLGSGAPSGPEGPSPSASQPASPSPAPTASAVSTPSPTPSPTPTPTPVPSPTFSPAGIVVDRDVPFTSEVPCDLGDASEGTCRMRLDVWRDRAVTAGPIVVTIHGRPRTRADMEPIARLVAERGAVVFNADYRGSAEVERGYPASFEDVACAIRFARAHAAEYGADPDGRVVLVGHSFGTYVGSIVALNGDAYSTEHCAAPAPSALPDVFVGLAGAYHWHTTPIWNTFFGTTYAKDPERWNESEPHNLLGGNPGLVWRFAIETRDEILEARSTDEFHEALLAAGYNSKLRTFPGSGHFNILALDGDGPAAARLVTEQAGIPVD